MPLRWMVVLVTRTIASEGAVISGFGWSSRGLLARTVINKSLHRDTSILRTRWETKTITRPIGRWKVKSRPSRWFPEGICDVAAKR